MFMPIVQGGHSGGALTLEITSNTSDVNILTLATAAGYNASTDTTAIIVNVASGVAITATSGNPAIRTGALNAASNLTINILSSATVCGFDGASTTSAGAAGGNGTDAILFEITSGTGTYEVVNNGTHVGAGSGGGGGGGSGGSAGARQTAHYDSKGFYSCGSPNVYGSAGAQGSHGSAGASCRAQNGSAGGTGSSGGYPSSPCGITVSAGSGSAGGAGGVAGRAINFGGLSVSTSGSGTFYGATS